VSKRFLERFPQFAEEFDDQGRTLIALAIKEAELELNSDLWGALFETGCFYLAADKLVQTPIGEHMRNATNPNEKTYFLLEFERLCRCVAMGACVA
jgi:hypothetical protein